MTIGGYRVQWRSHGSATAEPYASGLAQSLGAALTVMSVLEFPPGMNPDYAVNRLYLDELMKEVTTKLTDLKARAVALGIPAQFLMQPVLSRLT